MLAFLLGFFLEATIGMIGFWTLEVSSLLWVYMLFNFFLSGQMFPLNILPQPWETLAPVDRRCNIWRIFRRRCFCRKLQGPALWWGLAIEAAWVVFFIIACRMAFRRGVRRYGAFGG